MGPPKILGHGPPMATRREKERAFKHCSLSSLSETCILAFCAFSVVADYVPGFLFQNNERVAFEELYEETGTETHTWLYYLSNDSI